MHSICGNSFKTVGKAFQVKLDERMPRVCNAVIKVIKATGGVTFVIMSGPRCSMVWFHPLYYEVKLKENNKCKMKRELL